MYHLTKSFSRQVVYLKKGIQLTGIMVFLTTTLFSQKSTSNFDRLVWSDEFEIDGAVDTSKWFLQTRIPFGESWFNGEIQHYTDRTDNAIVEDGVLKIIAKRETYTNNGISKNYTSARLNSKFAFKYGKVEIRAKLPSGIGTWPALWMLGKNINEAGAYWETQGFGTTSWPECGEIDIMEHWGHNQNFVQSATHTPSSHGNTFNKGGQYVGTASSSFHVYTLEWTPDQLIFSVDDKIHFTYNPALKDGNTWPFDLQEYLVFNVAILPTISTSFTSSSMEVDYVRIYQESPLSVLEQLEHPNIKVFPVPFNSDLIIQFQEVNNQLLKVNIYDLGGKLIDYNKFRLVDKEIKLENLNQLDNGIYLIKLESEDLEHTIKVIKN